MTEVTIATQSVSEISIPNISVSEVIIGTTSMDEVSIANASVSEVTIGAVSMDEYVEDLIYPYGDFNYSTDVTAFWDDSLSSVTIQNLDSSTPVSIDGGALKILSNTNVDVSWYQKAIPVLVGKSYTIAGTTTATAHTVSIFGGSTSLGNEYFSILVASSGLPCTFGEDLLLGSLRFTATTDTFYLRVYFGTNMAYLSFDDISLIRG